MKLRQTALAALCMAATTASTQGDTPLPTAPDVLLIIADDLSYDHLSSSGCNWIRTPNLDALAASGVRFTRAHVQAPSCTPSRASILTGRSTWQLGPSAVLWGDFPAQFMTYPRQLVNTGYEVARFAKGWGPGRGFNSDFNPAGYSRDRIRRDHPLTDWNFDTPADFAHFIDGLNGRPYAVWMGFEEPHRPWREGAWQHAGIRLEDVEVPPFLPDTPKVREDLASYAAEIQHLDAEVGRVIDILRERDRLERTLIIFTSDNGMPFPRAKVTTYRAGTHVPLIISWTGTIPPNRTIDDLVTVTDLMPTILAATGRPIPDGITGRSLLPMLTSTAEGQVNPEWSEIVTGIERHDFGYHSPERTLISGRYLFVRHVQPHKPKPSGGNSPSHAAVREIDPGSDLGRLYAIRNGRMPPHELFDLETDPHCLHDVAGKPEHAELIRSLSARLDEILAAENDPRSRGIGYIFEFFPTFRFFSETDYNYDILPREADQPALQQR